jgi:hypothetical protein
MTSWDFLLLVKRCSNAFLFIKDLINEVCDEFSKGKQKHTGCIEMSILPPFDSSITKIATSKYHIIFYIILEKPIPSIETKEDPAETF